MQAILKNSLDLQQQAAQRTLNLPEHENLRGAANSWAPQCGSPRHERMTHVASPQSTTSRPV